MTQTNNPNPRVLPTKREYFAAIAMQGILSTQSKDLIEAGMWLSPESIAISAVKHADALIEELNKSQHERFPRCEPYYGTTEEP